MPDGIEIERKYLISRPEEDVLLREGAVKKEMVQTYLKSEKGVSERVRKVTQNGQIKYYHTVKTKLGPITRTEEEDLIGKEEYEKLLLRADEACMTIEKVRYVIKRGKYAYEIDLFPFWQDRAFLEIELESEDETPLLPPFLHILCDVSEKKGYSNHALAAHFGKIVD